MSFLYRFLPSSRVKIEQVDVKFETLQITIPPSEPIKEEFTEDDFTMPGSFHTPRKASMATAAYPTPTLSPSDRPRRRAVASEVHPISPPVTPLKSRESSRTIHSQTVSAGSSSTRSQSPREATTSGRPALRRSTPTEISETVAVVKRERLEPVLLTPPSTPVRAPRKPRTSQPLINDPPQDDEEIFNVESDATPTRPRRTRLRTAASMLVQAGPASEPPALIIQGECGMFRNGEKLQYFQALDLQLLLQRERGEPVCGTDVISNVGHVLAYDMGCGKTVMSISLIVLNPPPPDFEGVNVTLVVVPSHGIMDHWINEIKMFAPHLKAYQYSSVNQTLRLDVDVILCTYAQIQRQFCAKKDNLKEKSPLYNYIWYRIVTDEAHIFRDPKTQTAAGIWALEKKHGLCLTGTPAQNSWKDYYPLFKFLNVGYENIDDLKTYKRKILPKTKRSLPPPGAEKLLETLKGSFFIVREKVDPKTGIKLVNLPERIDHIIDVHLTPYERDVHEHVKTLPKHHLAIFIHLRQACDHVGLVANFVSRAGLCGKDVERLRTFSSGGVFNYGIHSSKIRKMVEILQKRPPGEKTIIFTHFTACFKPVTQALKEERIVWVEYSGDLDTKEREESLRKIKEDTNCSVIVISILAGGVGLNIISCSSVILLDPWWNPYVEEQAISRVHRIGQVKPVNVYHLVSVDTVEVYIMETQALKRRMIEGNTEGSYNDAFEDVDMDKLDEAAFEEWLSNPNHGDNEDAAWRGIYDSKSDEPSDQPTQ